jgi:hypothetical protein
MSPIFIRDLSGITRSEPMPAMGSISSHTRPIECLEGKALSDDTAVLYTADTMGVIKIWHLHKDNGLEPRWTPTLNKQLDRHRTRINEMLFGNGELWTGKTFICGLETYPDDAPLSSSIGRRYSSNHTPAALLQHPPMSTYHSPNCGPRNPSPFSDASSRTVFDHRRGRRDTNL